ncbi:hypothetical protein AB0B45_20370 [Nonomuraea sp. NPDC049152]|uniref:hypothetical protein n=1 Tax=Nonomuraea sp. NPDC049152 TaxID=3154350 RepID=UPI0033D6281A
MAVLGFLIYTNPMNGPAGWLLPVMQDHRPDWPDRPSAVHLVYVLALAVAFGGIALLKHRVRLAPAAAVVVALAVAVPSGAIAAAEPSVARPSAGELSLDDVDPRVRERYFGKDAHRCSVRQGITYCAYPGYEPWIPLWEQAVRPIAEALPAALGARMPRVEQTSYTWFFGDDSDTPMVRPPMTWGSLDQRRMLAEDVALWATGLADASARAGEIRAGERCDVRGQARTVVTIWLMGHVAAWSARPTPRWEPRHASDAARPHS